MSQSKTKFLKAIQNGYSPSGESIMLGKGMLDGKSIPETSILLPLKTLNRHGLIAGATGSGKTKTLQVIAGELSDLGVPSLLMDIKGDLSGLAKPGTLNPKIKKRHKMLDIPFEPKNYPVEFLTISMEKGVKLRATVSEFGPVLLTKILDLSKTQSGILSVLFKFCDDNGLLLLDLKDLKKVLHFSTNEGKAAIEKEYGRISPSSSATILRKIVALEQQGATQFFGELSFDVNDLLKFNENGSGAISIIRLKDIQDKPSLFSTFMLQLLAEVYERFPEEGDLDRPKLVIFIDEAHLIFNGASKVLIDQIEMTVKLIRSKGVGIVFCTQVPDDVPSPILSQLGFKAQHALRAFTAKDRKAIKKAAENFPVSMYYKTDRLLTEMGIGEALITTLSEKGRPTPLAHTMIRAPASRMGVLKKAELTELIASSLLAKKYNEKIDRLSAYEILSEKAEKLEKQKTTKKTRTRGRQKDESTLGKIVNSSIAREVGRTAAREITRGILGVFGIKTGRRR